jgi:tetratricopeptide (TPR) repeat protein
MKRLLLIALLAVAACSADRGHPVDQVGPSAAASDATLRALEQAQRLHHEADLAVSRGDLDHAIDSVRAVLAVSFPAGAPEAEDVFLDARARLGLLLLQANRLDEAERVVDDGLAQATRESFFLANLYSVRGKLHEARQDAHAAIDAYERGQQMNFRVQDRLYKEARP